MSRTLPRLLLLAMMFAAPASATTVTVDFNTGSGVWQVPGGIAGDVYDEDGFHFRTEPGWADPNSPALESWRWTNQQDCVSVPVPECFPIVPHVTLLTYPQGSQIFDLLSVRILVNTEGIEFVGTGGNLYDVFFAAGDVGIKTLNFSVTSVSIRLMGEPAFNGLDDFQFAVAEPVAEPSSVLLLAFGVGAGLVRRVRSRP